MRNNHRDVVGNIGKEYIYFDRSVVPGFTACDTHVGCKVIDGMFYNDTDLVKVAQSSESLWMSGNLLKDKCVYVRGTGRRCF